jgi:hypothetical protein
MQGITRYFLSADRIDEPEQCIFRIPRYSSFWNDKSRYVEPVSTFIGAIDAT